MRIRFIALLLAISIGTHAKDFYVSPLGNDSNTGTKELPFKTIGYARDKVREWNLANGIENITVWLAGGQYNLSETLVFSADDSAKPGQTITYSALPGENPVICSEVTISGWKKLEQIPKGLPKKATGKIWVAPVPVGVNSIKVLFIGKYMLPRASTTAFRHMRQPNDLIGINELHTTMPFHSEMMDSVFNPVHAEIVVIPTGPWTMNILPVKTIDKAKGVVYLGASSTYTLGKPKWYTSAESVWVENTFAGMNKPGNWVCDSDARLIYYWPLNNNSPEENLVVPGLIELIRVEGNIDYNGPVDHPVKGLVFNGITFTHGDRFNSSGQTGMGLQHDWERFDASTALFRFRGAEDCKVSNCSFLSSGGAGIRCDLFAQNIKIVSNELSELGGGGILLAGYGPGTKDVNKNNVISNNYIHDIGKIWWHSIGIWAWQSGHNLIDHNTIQNIPYSGIAVTGRIVWDKSGSAECSRTVRWNEVGAFTGKESWEERERFLHGRQNIIANNDINHVMEKMQDGNAIYISGAGHGNVLQGNYVHDTPSQAAGEQFVVTTISMKQ